MNKIYCGVILLAAVVGSVQSVRPCEKQHQRAKRSYDFHVKPIQPRVGETFSVLVEVAGTFEFDSKRSSIQNVKLIDYDNLSDTSGNITMEVVFEALEVGDAKLVFIVDGKNGEPSYRVIKVKIVE
jgi:hypothetical protein